MDYDVILIHPPAVYDFREKVIFPGLISYTGGQRTVQFIIPSVGMLSIADYLDRNGYKVLVDNIGERMITDKRFDAERHIKNLSAKVYAIGLHWCVHSQGAIEIARLCKKLHPDAMVVLGGLTATVFHEEIIRKYDFIDIVIRGEAEKPFLLLMNALGKHKKLKEVPNLTFREGGDGIRSNPLMKPSVDLDEFEYTRFELIEPKKSIFPPGIPPHWFIPICRGCLNNCVTCGGSAYNYRIYSGREQPAFRSPEKIAEDIQKLGEQGVHYVSLSQDPRMGGKEYWKRLLATLQNGKFEINQLTMEICCPANKEYLKELSKIGMPLVLTISPESGVDSVRRAHGRNYTNEELFRTIKLCKKHNIPLEIHSMIALANDTNRTIKKTWEIWEQICSTNQKSQGKVPVSCVFGPMILLDPGSLAFDFPKRYGYRLIFKNLEDYVKGMSLPSWHQWISYETKHLNRDSIIKLFINSIEYSINLRERYGLCNSFEADMARFCFLTINKLLINLVNQTMYLHNEDEKLRTLRSFRECMDKNIPHLMTRLY